MSEPVDLAVLAETIASLGPEAVLVTVSRESTPHVVSVLVTETGGTLTMGGGRRTRANVAINPGVTLMWTAVHDSGCRLIVDGTASVTAETVVVAPSAAIFHRVATAPDGPTCRPVER